MKQITLYALLAMNMVFLGTSSAAIRLDAGDIPPFDAPEVVRLEEGVHIKQDAGKRIFVEVVGSPHLTDSFRVALSRQGLTLASDQATADVVYQLDGMYQAIRTAARTGQVTLGGSQKTRTKLSHKG